jgi:hypothetical protein
LRSVISAATWIDEKHYRWLGFLTKLLSIALEKDFVMVDVDDEDDRIPGACTEGYQ